jgi:hypothetical protein
MIMTTTVNPRFDAHGDPASRALETWLEMWGAELQVFAYWQQTLLGMQQGLFDVWAAHFAGGAPIDG